MTHFGEQLTYDGYNGDYTALNCRETVSKALSDLVIAVGMTVLSGPGSLFRRRQRQEGPRWLDRLCRRHGKPHQQPHLPGARLHFHRCTHLQERTGRGYHQAVLFVPVSRFPMRKSISSSVVRAIHSTTSAERNAHKSAAFRIVT
jgi:hypothetical protein